MKAVITAQDLYVTSGLVNKGTVFIVGQRDVGINILAHAGALSDDSHAVALVSQVHNRLTGENARSLQDVFIYYDQVFIVEATGSNSGLSELSGAVDTSRLHYISLNLEDDGQVGMLHGLISKISDTSVDIRMRAESGGVKTLSIGATSVHTAEEFRHYAPRVGASAHEIARVRKLIEEDLLESGEGGFWVLQVAKALLKGGYTFKFMILYVWDGPGRDALIVHPTISVYSPSTAHVIDMDPSLFNEEHLRAPLHVNFDEWVRLLRGAFPDSFIAFQEGNNDDFVRNRRPRNLNEPELREKVVVLLAPEPFLKQINARNLVSQSYTGTRASSAHWSASDLVFGEDFDERVNDEVVHQLKYLEDAVENDLPVAADFYLNGTGIFPGADAAFISSVGGTLSGTSNQLSSRQSARKFAELFASADDFSRWTDFDHQAISPAEFWDYIGAQRPNVTGQAWFFWIDDAKLGLQLMLLDLDGREDLRALVICSDARFDDENASKKPRFVTLARSALQSLYATLTHSPEHALPFARRLLDLKGLQFSNDALPEKVRLFQRPLNMRIFLSNLARLKARNHLAPLERVLDSRVTDLNINDTTRQVVTDGDKIYMHVGAGKWLEASLTEAESSWPSAPPPPTTLAQYTSIRVEGKRYVRLGEYWFESGDNDGSVKMRESGGGGTGELRITASESSPTVYVAPNVHRSAHSGHAFFDVLENLDRFFMFLHLDGILNRTSGKAFAPDDKETVTIDRDKFLHFEDTLRTQAARQPQLIGALSGTAFTWRFRLVEIWLNDLLGFNRVYMVGAVPGGRRFVVDPNQARLHDGRLFTRFVMEEEDWLDALRQEIRQVGASGNYTDFDSYLALEADYKPFPKRKKKRVASRAIHVDIKPPVGSAVSSASLREVQDESGRVSSRDFKRISPFFRIVDFKHPDFTTETGFVLYGRHEYVTKSGDTLHAVAERYFGTQFEAAYWGAALIYMATKARSVVSLTGEALEPGVTLSIPELNEQVMEYVTIPPLEALLPQFLFTRKYAKVFKMKWPSLSQREVQAYIVKESFEPLSSVMHKIDPDPDFWKTHSIWQVGFFNDSMYKVKLAQSAGMIYRDSLCIAMFDGP